MITYIKKKGKILKAVALVTYKEWSAYRTHSMVSIFVGPVYFIVQYYILTAIYGDCTMIKGIELEQMIRYFGVTALLGYLTMDFADWNLSMLVRTGKYITFALRPVHHRFFALSQKIGHRFLGFVVEFIPCLAIFILLFRVDMRPANLSLTVLSIIFAFLMKFYVNYILGMIAFWFVQSSGLRYVFNLISSIFSGSLLPLVFFPEWMQLLQFFLPFQYITYVPAMVFIGNYQLGNFTLPLETIVGIQGVAVVITALLSEAIYRQAMKHFTGVGA